MLNMQFDRPVVIDTNQLDWQPSPRPGVWRKLLAREEAERGHEFAEKPGYARQRTEWTAQFA